MKLKVLKIGKFLLILSVSLFVLLRLLQLSFILLLYFGSQPDQIKELDETHKQRITACTGVTLPSNAEFVEGWYLPSRDPAYIYVFDLDASQKSDDETVDEYLRNTLDLNVWYYSITGQALHTSGLAELGYPFLWTIEYQDVNYDECHYAYVHYYVIDENTIRFAFEFGFM